MKWKLGSVIAALVALVGGSAYAVHTVAAEGPVPAMPLIYDSYPEGAHAQVSVDGVRRDREPKVIAAPPGGQVTLTALLGSRRLEETVSVARFRVECWVRSHVSFTAYQRVTLPAYLDPTVPPETVPVTGTMDVPPCQRVTNGVHGQYSGKICIVVGAREGDDLGASCREFLVVKGALPGPELPGLEAAGVVPLWRAVAEAELKSVEERGAYTVIQGLEGKYFFPTREQAENFAKLAQERGWGTYVVTQAEIDARHLAKAEAIAAAGEGSAYFLRNGLVKLVRLVRIFK
ncbi:hypothetical protein AB0K12_33165 [Nonomuraea sp. NPDC049419]|uniref:hypothetical protein n=1 Tax=Nonomuraea sp. NPDC049419 TaxID=3155772 RepID=UPI003412BCC3